MAPAGRAPPVQLKVTDVLKEPVGIIWNVIDELGLPMTSATVVVEAFPSVKPPTFTVTGMLCTTGPTEPVATMLRLDVLPRKVVSTKVTVKGLLTPPESDTGALDPAPGQVAPAGTVEHVSVTVPV